MLRQRPRRHCRNSGHSQCSRFASVTLEPWQKHTQPRQSSQLMCEQQPRHCALHIQFFSCSMKTTWGNVTGRAPRGIQHHQHNSSNLDLRRAAVLCAPVPPLPVSRLLIAVCWNGSSEKAYSFAAGAANFPGGN